MKKFKQFRLPLALLLAVLTVGFLSAFTQKNNKPVEDDLYWFSGTTYTLRHQTRSLELPESGCPDAGPYICEKGFAADDFVVTGDPTSGLKNDAEPDALIMKEQ